MKQRDIWLTDLDPTKGSEQAEIRPVVIISGDLMNKHLNVVITCPLTTKIKNYQGNVVLLPDDKNQLKQTSEILTFHLRSMSKDRLLKKVGVISNEELQQIKNCLDDILRY
ncbi:transcription elongation factor GreAB [Brumimicrobium salinarum]|uniref:mRNA interferase n=1 Tax=Brumimicrobium salinarum TaxID=2058658 RepID=A0A2I0R3W3_9FLAO|nr:transcription elongation factor GreAB [Brumimicrobium salinarum]